MKGLNKQQAMPQSKEIPEEMKKKVSEIYQSGRAYTQEAIRSLPIALSLKVGR